MLEQLLLSQSLPPIAPAIESMNAITNLKLVEQRHGLTLLACRTVAESLKRGTLVALPVLHLPPAIPIVVVHRAQCGQRAIVDRFHDAARALLQDASSASNEANL
jgi:DNA-binding transcriptional LysR family regulator